MTLRPKVSEIVNQSLMFDESAKQFGYKCRVLIPSDIDLPKQGFQQDIGYNEEDAIEVYAVPVNGSLTPKLLKKLGWDIESSNETKPFLIQMRRYIKKEGKAFEIIPTIYTKILFDYSYVYDEKEFIVTNVSSNTFNPIYYILSMAPYRYQLVENHEPLQDENLSLLNVQETDERFHFLQVPKRGQEIKTKY